MLFFHITELNVIKIVFLFQADDPHGVGAALSKCRPQPPSGPPPAGSPPPPPPRGGPPVELLNCAAKELSLIDADGNVNEAGIKQHVEHVENDANKVGEIVQACAVNQASGDETVRELWKCLHDKNIFQQPKHRHQSSESSSSESEEHSHHHHH